MAGTVQLLGTEKLIADLKKMCGSGKPAVKAGVIENSTYPDGESVVAVAAINEFGGPHTPPRPFMRHTVNAKKFDWVQLLAGYLKQGMQPKRALDYVGKAMMDDIQEAIYEPAGGWKKPNAPETLAMKHSDIPLVDTSVLLHAIDYVVTDNA